MLKRRTRYILIMLILPLCVMAADNAPEICFVKTVGGWYNVTLLAENIWRIDDHGNDNMYLVVGQDSALLIDTGIGVADLASCVKELTDLPVIVVNTHGHPDHSGGNYQFKQIYAHPADFQDIELFTSPEYHTSEVQQVIGQNPELESVLIKDISAYNNARNIPVKAGYVFDLGGRHLEVIETPGHTPGSIVLLDKENRHLFTGDNNNTLVWLFLPASLPLEVYLHTLESLNARNDEFDDLYPGHGKVLDKTFLDDMIACTRQIVDGKCEGEVYNSFVGQAMKCTYGRASVAFDPEKIHSK